MQKINPFHLAIPVNDLKKCRKFYQETLGCIDGRTSEKWVDLDLFGHQLVIHQSPKAFSADKQVTNPVDRHNVPVPHFGVVLEWNQWINLAEKLKAGNVQFVIEPYVRFKDEAGEQATCLFWTLKGMRWNSRHLKISTTFLPKIDEDAETSSA